MFWPRKPPPSTATQKQISLWAGEASAAGAQSQFIAALLTILVLFGTLIILILGITALKSTNKQLDVLSDQLKILNDQQMTLTEHQKILSEQQKLMYAQYKLFVIGLKPFFVINGSIELNCKNPDKNKYHVEIINISDNPAKDVTLYFRVIMRGETDFKDIAPIRLRDIDKNRNLPVVKDDIEGSFNAAVRERYGKALTEKNAISGIYVYCTYKDKLGTPYNDKELKNTTKLHLLYCD